MKDDLAELGLEYECTVSIVCHTILDNWDRLVVENRNSCRRTASSWQL